MDEQTQILLTHLEKLSAGQLDIISRIGTLATDIALLKQAQSSTNKRFENCSAHMAKTNDLSNDISEIKEKIRPLMMVVYGVVTLALIAIGGALLTHVVK